MGAGERPATEEKIQALCEAGRWQEAATVWIEELGPEMITFLSGLQSSHVDAQEVFSEFCEDLWKSLPGFRWACSARTWSYRIARNVWLRALLRARRRGAVPLSAMPELHEVAERVRTATAAYRRTDVKDRFAALREELPPDDQMLLILRIDRGLSWAAAAAVMAGDGEDLGRVTTRIRKQFQRVKQRVRELAIARGLVPGEDD